MTIAQLIDANQAQSTRMPKVPLSTLDLSNARWRDTSYDPVKAALAALPAEISDPAVRQQIAEIVARKAGTLAPEAAAAWCRVPADITNFEDRARFALQFGSQDFSLVGELQMPNMHEENYAGPRPWMEWPNPPELHRLWYGVKPLSGLQFNDPDNQSTRQFPFDRFNQHYSHGDSLRGHAFTHFRLMRTLPKRLDACYDGPLPIVPEGSAAILDKHCPKQIEFIELDVELASGVTLTEKFYYMNIRNVAPCIHPYSLGYRAGIGDKLFFECDYYTPNFASYEITNRYHIFRPMECFKHIYLRPLLRDALNRGGYRVSSQHDSASGNTLGVYFIDGRCYHPDLMSAWPPQLIETPDRMVVSAHKRAPERGLLENHLKTVSGHPLNAMNANWKTISKHWHEFMCKSGGPGYYYVMKNGVMSVLWDLQQGNTSI